MTTRRLMAAVAAVALLLAAGLYCRRRAGVFRRLADEYGLREAYAETTMGIYDHETTLRTAAQMEDVSHTEEEWAAIVAADRRRAAYDAKLRRKYERAGRYPWLPVPPDPPPK